MRLSDEQQATVHMIETRRIWLHEAVHAAIDAGVPKARIANALDMDRGTLHRRYYPGPGYHKKHPNDADRLASCSTQG